MKKLIMVAALAVAGFAMASTEVYDFKMTLNVPYLDSGVRQYKSCAYTGYMYMEYTNDNESVSKVWVMCKNKKTKVDHVIDFTDGFYALMGKSNKNILRTVPTVYFEGEDIDNESHEEIEKITLSGNGTIKIFKGKGCGYCGDSTADCARLQSMKGSVTGTMLCNCPDDLDWTHTILAGICGLLWDGEELDRTERAAFWGTWSAKRNAKLSE